MYNFIQITHSQRSVTEKISKKIVSAEQKLTLQYKISVLWASTLHGVQDTAMTLH